MPLFKREVKLVVYTTTKKVEIIGLHMDFDILLRRKSDPNLAKINIFNLSAPTRAILEQEHLGIEFLAGYESEPKLVFMGTTSNVVHDKQGPDWMTTIYAADGQKEFEKTYFDKTYSAGTNYRQIFTDLALAMGFSINIDPALSGSPMASVLLRSRSFSGKAKKVMDQLVKDLDLNWTVQFGAIEVTKAESTFSTATTAVLFTYYSGMIGSPVVVYEKKKKSRKSKPAFTKSIQLTSLLNPEARPNRLIEVSSLQPSLSFSDLAQTKVPKPKADGIYLCEEAQFIGSNYGNEFDVRIKGIE